MTAKFVRESLEFTRPGNRKKGLKVGLKSMLDQMTSGKLGMLENYWSIEKWKDSADEMDGYEYFYDEYFTDEDREYIKRISPLVKDTIIFGEFHYNDEEGDEEVVKEAQEPWAKGKHTYWTDTDAEDGYIVAYSSIPLPAARPLNLDEFKP